MDTPATRRSVPLLVSVACLFLVASAAPDQRSEALAAAREAPGGARIIETGGGDVLIATALVPLPADLRPEKAFSVAAAAALIEARAEAALFLGGEFASSTESGSASSSTSGSDSARDARVETWTRLHATSLAHVKLTAGEPLEIALKEGGVRATVAWGLASPEGGRDSVNAETLGLIADGLIAAAEVPACTLEWISDKDGNEGLRFSLAVHPDSPLGACVKNQQASDCACARCRERTLDVQAQKLIGGWAKEGDVAVVRSLTRISTRTQTLARDGAVAMKRISERSKSSQTRVSFQAVIPPDFFRRWTRVFRHADSRSICVGFVPIDATPGAESPDRRE
jgi:hypothetical protein